MQQGGPPAWANPLPPSPPSVEQHESELFAPYSTLDEPVMETILRDVRAVGAKLRVVMRPLDRNPVLYAPVSSDGNAANANSNSSPDQEEVLSENDRQVLQQLKDWDLWGPLVLCLVLGIILSLRAPKDQSSLVFAAVISSVWVGGTIVTVNAQLLGELSRSSNHFAYWDIPYFPWSWPGH